MDLDDIGYFGLPINGAVTPSIESLPSSSSSRLRNPSRRNSKSAVGVAATTASSSAWKQLQNRPQTTSTSSQVLNKRKRGLISSDVATRKERRGDTNEGEALPLLPVGYISRIESLVNADSASDATKTSGERAAPSLDHAIAKPDSRSNNEKKAKPKHQQQRSIESFFSAPKSSSQRYTQLYTMSAPQHDFVTAASMDESVTLQDTIDIRSNHGSFEDELVNFSHDELCVKESEEQKQAIINGQCKDEKILGTTTNHHDVDNNHHRSRECRRFNHVEFGIRNCILGHRLLPATKMKRKNRNESSKNRTQPSQLRQHDGERQMHEQRLLHGTCGNNILSRLVQRSCIPSSMSSSSIASSMETFVNSGNHWNICNTVKLAASNDDDNDDDDAGYNASLSAVPPHSNSGDICAMSFDRDGVLLATGDDRGIVRIYDFDDVYAMDMKRRNEISRLFCRDYSVKEGIDEKEGNENEERRHVDSEFVVDEDHSEEDSDSIPVRSIPPVAARPVLSFQCNVSRSSSANTRISSILWSPYNQDHLAITFANQQEIHIYDTASEETPIPCLRLLDSRHSCSEGMSKAMFLPPLPSSTSTHLITGGNYGTVSLWTIPQTRSRRRDESISKHSAKCIWSIPAFSSNGEGVSDMILLPIGGASANKSSNTLTKPLVLVAGNGSSLTLLDTNKCTRKAFSATITPSVVSSWDLYQHTLRELSPIYPEAKLPTRKWISAHKLILLRQEFTLRNSRIRIGIILKCGWILIADLSPSRESLSSSSFDIQIQIVHLTPRIQCFNSSNERLTTLGGMALQFSLPELPVPSINYSGATIWVGDVKQLRYSLPSKDKYILGEEHGTFTTQTNQALSSGTLRHPGAGLMLAQLGPGIENRRLSDSCICARLPLSRGLPSSLAAHPSGEWIVVGCRRGATNLVAMRKRDAQQPGKKVRRKSLSELALQLSPF